MNTCSKIFALLLLITLHSSKSFSDDKSQEYITIAILAKDKAHTLDLYLSCIEKQTWPAEKTYLYIRTNNNNDNSAEILRDWIERVKDRYAEIYFDDSNVDVPVEQFGQHEWNYTRFQLLGVIRQESVNWAYNHHSHYFVVDCDNFIFPETIERMHATNIGIIAPMLRCDSNKYYSNYHHMVDRNGYYTHSDTYYDILYQRIRGILDVAVVHCSYFIRYELLDAICYDDESARYEYVIFSDWLRRHNIAQYIDNRSIYGYISFAENKEEFEREPFLCQFNY